MSSVASIIEVYRMKELTPVVRANVMVKLGHAINEEYSMNITGELVGELLKTLPINPEDLGKYASWHPTNKEGQKV